MAVWPGISKPVCEACKGRGWVFKDILMGLTGPCECRKVEPVKEKPKVPVGGIVGWPALPSPPQELIIDGSIIADKVINHRLTPDQVRQIMSGRITGDKISHKYEWTDKDTVK